MIPRGRDHLTGGIVGKGYRLAVDKGRAAVGLGEQDKLAQSVVGVIVGKLGGAVLGEGVAGDSLNENSKWGAVD